MCRSQLSADGRSHLRVTARSTPRAEKHLKKYFGKQFIFSNRILLSSKPSELKSHSGSRAAGGKKDESGEGERVYGLESKVKSGCQLTENKQVWPRQRWPRLQASGRCWYRRASLPRRPETNGCHVLSFFLCLTLPVYHL